jgi:hypothetical protein
VQPVCQSSALPRRAHASHVIVSRCRGVAPTATQSHGSRDSHAASRVRPRAPAGGPDISCNSDECDGAYLASGGSGPREPGVSILVWSISTEIYLCHACSYQELLRMETAGQAHPSACAGCGMTA